MKYGILSLTGTLIAILLISGCITGRVNDTVNADGSLNRHIEIDKAGFLVTATCKSLVSMMEAGGNFSMQQVYVARNNCRETDDTFVFDIYVSPGDDLNPVRLINKNDESYLRYQADNSILPTTVRMPSTITSHNGELVDEYTVFFKGNLSSSLDSRAINYAESKQPEPINILIPAVIIFVVVAMGVSIVMLTKRKTAKDETFEWECEKCGKTYPTKKECDRHEKTCRGN